MEIRKRECPYEKAPTDRAAIGTKSACAMSIVRGRGPKFRGDECAKCQDSRERDTETLSPRRTYAPILIANWPGPIPVANAHNLASTFPVILSVPPFSIRCMGLQGWIAAIAVGFMITGCSTSPPVPPAETVTVTTERTVAATPAPTIAPVPAPSVPAATAAPAAQSWTMPTLIGRNLQEAQDAIQALTDNEIFYSGSTDLTGKGRNQIMDANWQVCTSTPPPGSTITKDTMIDFGVVRIDVEDCP